MVNFKTLWKNFPDKGKMKVSCTNKQKAGNKPFSNYCAILLSECFNRSGVNISSFTGNRCWSHAGKKHILLASHLADALAKNPPSGFGRREKITPGTFQHKLKNRTGVIYFKDYWQRGKESFTNRSGDHIDLWSKNQISGHGMSWRTFIEFLGIVSDLNKSKEIWFWEIK